VNYRYTPEEIGELNATIDRYRAALEIIAGVRPCVENLMGDKDIARAALNPNNPLDAANR
jgi:hypothetical protein